MSFLLSEGHRDPGLYPLAMLITEAEIARKRVNSRIKTETALMQSAFASVYSKQAGSKLNKTLSEM